MKLSVGIVALALASGGIWLAAPARAAPSTFQESCTNIRMHGATQKAKCRRIDQSWVETSLAIDGIENIDGNLRYTNNGPSSFQLTCTDIGVSGDMLFAKCRRRDQSEASTRLRLQNIENINGALTLR
jgi:hypothetical protein